MRKCNESWDGTLGEGWKSDQSIQMLGLEAIIASD